MTTYTTAPVDNLQSNIHSINATNIEAAISLPDGTLIVLGTLTMVSISTHREKFPVTRIGSTGAVGFTRGHRMIAGTLVFSIVDKSAFIQLSKSAQDEYTTAEQRQTGHGDTKTPFWDMKADELPPFDIHILYSTPDNILCYEGLIGVTILDEGSVRSMDMLQISESYSYMALDRVPLQRLPGGPSTAPASAPLTPGSVYL